MKTLHEARRITLIRCENGWIDRTGDYEYQSDPKWVFESTYSLSQNLVKLLGESKWKIEPEEIVSVPQKPPDKAVVKAGNHFEFHLCKRYKFCGNTCEEYSPGNFSVQCKACNEEKARKARIRSAKRRAQAA